MSSSDDTVTGREQRVGENPGESTLSWETVAPPWLTNETLVNRLKAFARNPAGVVLGAVLTTLLAGVETIVEGLIDSILFLVLGSDGVPSATGAIGIADIPLYFADILGIGGGVVTAAITTAIRDFNRAAVELATLAGPLSPVVYAALLALSFVAAAWALRTALSVVADLLQLGGLVK